MKHLSSFVLILSLGLVACKKESNETPTALETKRYDNLPADPSTAGPGQQPRGTGRFTLFSLSQGRIIPNADSASNQWDLGFRGTSIIVNGGAMRVGQGGLAFVEGLFDELKTVPQNQVFGRDESPSQMAQAPGSGASWYNYEPQRNLISPIPGRILLIKTATGHYAKLEILSYYRNAPAQPTANDEARYYTFRYVYQANGSQDLH